MIRSGFCKLCKSGDCCCFKTTGSEGNDFMFSLWTVTSIGLQFVVNNLFVGDQVVRWKMSLLFLAWIAMLSSKSTSRASAKPMPLNTALILEKLGNFSGLQRTYQSIYPRCFEICRFVAAHVARCHWLIGLLWSFVPARNLPVPYSEMTLTGPISNCETKVNIHTRISHNWDQTCTLTKKGWKG